MLVHALSGFVDAGAAVQQATDHLLAALPSRIVATFDVDQLHDYRARRPPMVFVEDHWESVEVPRLELHQVTDSAGNGFLLLVGPEPDTQWERFIAAMAGVVHDFDVRLTIGLTAIPMGVPHTRPVRLTAHATRPDLIAGYTPWVGTVVVPGSVGNLLELRFGEQGLDAMGFAAGVPHYLAQLPYPAASVALLDGVARAAGLVLPDADLRTAADETRTSVDDQLRESPEGAALVTSLEQRTTPRSRPASCRRPTSWVPSWSASSPRSRDPTTRAADPPAGLVRKGYGSIPLRPPTCRRSRPPRSLEVS